MSQLNQVVEMEQDLNEYHTFKSDVRTGINKVIVRLNKCSAVSLIDEEVFDILEDLLERA